MIFKDKEKHIKRNETGKGFLDEEITENKKFNKKQIITAIGIGLILIYSLFNFLGIKGEVKQGFYENENKIMKIENETIKIREYQIGENGEKTLSEEKEEHEINIEEGRFEMNGKEYYINRNDDIFSNNEYWEYIGGEND